MWLDWLVFCDYGFSVSALRCPLATPTVLLGFLLPCMWGISSQLLQQSTATAPYLGRGVSPHHRPSWPWTWSSSSRPSCNTQPPLLGCGVAPLGRWPWPRVWGDEMAVWHHRLNGWEFEWTPGGGDGQGGLACCDSWGRKESDTTERLNWTELNWNRVSNDMPGAQPWWSRHAEVMVCWSHRLTFLGSLIQMPGSIWFGSTHSLLFISPTKFYKLVTSPKHSNPCILLKNRKTWHPWARISTWRPPSWVAWLWHH